MMHSRPSFISLQPKQSFPGCIAFAVLASEQPGYALAGEQNPSDLGRL